MKILYMKYLVDGDIIKLENVINEDFYNYTKVFLNGTIVGVHRDPQYLLKYMRLLKLNSFINIGTSISWNIKTGELHVFCDWKNNKTHI